MTWHADRTLLASYRDGATGEVATAAAAVVCVEPAVSADVEFCDVAWSAVEAARSSENSRRSSSRIEETPDGLVR